MSYVVSPADLNTFLNYTLVHLPDYIFFEAFSYDLMFMTGCRAEESFRRDLWSKLDHNTYILSPLKGNSQRVIPRSKLPADFVNWYNNTPVDHKTTSFRKLQYNLSNIIGGYQFSCLGKGVLTHLFRHNFAKQLFIQGFTRNQIKNAFGHTQVTNTNVYIDSVIHTEFSII